MFVVTKKLFKEKEARDYLWPGCCFAENPFCGNRKLGGEEESVSPALGRREAEASKPRRFLQNDPFLQHHSLLNMVIKPQGGRVSSWFLAPRSTPNGNLEIHIWIHTHMLQQAL